MRTLNLTSSASVTVASNGTAVAQAGPSLPGEVWLPVSANISMTGTTPTGVATCFIYAGNGTGPGDFTDSTYQVMGAASSVISGKQLFPGQVVTAVWSGCNPGATATLSVKGTRQVP